MKEENKNNNVLIVLVGMLIILVLGLSGYIIFDKKVSKPTQNIINDNNCVDEQNQNKNAIEKNYEQAYDYLVNELKCSFYDAKSYCSDTFYISAKCENDIIKEIHYDDVVHNRTENSSGIGIEIKTDKVAYTNNEEDSTFGDAEYNMNVYYKVLESAGINEMELINGMKYAYEISEKNNNVLHDPYCD